MPALKLNERRKFDMNNEKDVEVYKHFLLNNDWKAVGYCPFELEYPYTSVPAMIKDKLVRKFLGV